MIFFIVTFFFFNILLFFYFEKFSNFVNLFDLPDGKRKIHKKPIAAIGGLLIFLNLFFYFIFLTSQYFFYDKYIFYSSNIDFIIFYFFSSLFFLTGFLDDKFGIGPNFKLILFTFIISLLLFFSESMSLRNLSFTFLENTISIKTISFPFTVFCILLFINAFNMFDGINLQSSIYSLHIFFIFLFQGLFLEISIVMIFSLLFFSYLNYKNRCFLGNGGSLLVAFIISYLFIKSQSTPTPFFADQIFLAMQIPGLDLLRLAIQRSVAGEHPFFPDRNHIHHLLLKKYGYKKTLLFLSGIIIIPNFLSTVYSKIFVQI